MTFYHIYLHSKHLAAQCSEIYSRQLLIWDLRKTNKSLPDNLRAFVQIKENHFNGKKKGCSQGPGQFCHFSTLFCSEDLPILLQPLPILLKILLNFTLVLQHNGSYDINEHFFN